MWLLYAGLASEGDLPANHTDYNVLEIVDYARRISAITSGFSMAILVFPDGYRVTKQIASLHAKERCSHKVLFRFSARITPFPPFVSRGEFSLFSFRYSGDLALFQTRKVQGMYSWAGYVLTFSAFVVKWPCYKGNGPAGVDFFENLYKFCMLTTSLASVM